MPKIIRNGVTFGGSTYVDSGLYYPTEAAADAAFSSLPEGAIIYTPEANSNDLTALQVEYDNTTSGMTATELQGAVDELNQHLSEKIVRIIKSVTTDNFGYFTVPEVETYRDNGYVVLSVHYNIYASPNMTSSGGYLYKYDGSATPTVASNVTTPIYVMLAKIS